MIKSCTGWSAGALAALAAAAMSITLFAACSHAARPASSQPRVPTYAIGQPAKTLEDALTHVRDDLEIGPPFAGDIRSVVYVETTYGQVVSLRKFNGLRRDENIPPFPDSLPVWLFVAYGQFQDRSMPGSTTPGQTYTTRFLLIAKGEKAFSDGATNEEYDLSSLGTVVHVSLPLPPFPTPVKLEAQ